MTLEDESCYSPSDHGSPPILQTLEAGVLLRDKPMVHPAVDPPLCEMCQKMEMAFFDPNCPGCQDLLTSPDTTLPEIYAVLRQWTPQTQQSLEILIRELLKRGAHVNDRDGLTDMTMLHYAAKAGASGVGDIEEACRMVHLLLAHDADVYIRSRWTNMTSLHYATYFDIVSVMKILLKSTGAIDVDSPCVAFDRGTPLHIAAANLAVDAARCLVQNGANPHIRDDLQRTPLGLQEGEIAVMGKAASKHKKTEDGEPSSQGSEVDPSEALTKISGRKLPKEGSVDLKPLSLNICEENSSPKLEYGLRSVWVIGTEVDSDTQEDDKTMPDAQIKEDNSKEVCQRQYEMDSPISHPYVESSGPNRFGTAVEAQGKKHSFPAVTIDQSDCSIPNKETIHSEFETHLTAEQTAEFAASQSGSVGRHAAHLILHPGIQLDAPTLLNNDSHQDLSADDIKERTANRESWRAEYEAQGLTTGDTFQPWSVNFTNESQSKQMKKPEHLHSQEISSEESDLKKAEGYLYTISSEEDAGQVEDRQLLTARPNKGSDQTELTKPNTDEVNEDWPTATGTSKMADKEFRVRSKDTQSLQTAEGSEDEVTDKIHEDPINLEDDFAWRGGDNGGDLNDSQTGGMRKGERDEKQGNSERTGGSHDTSMEGYKLQAGRETWGEPGTQFNVGPEVRNENLVSRNDTQKSQDWVGLEEDRGRTSESRAENFAQRYSAVDIGPGVHVAIGENNEPESFSEGADADALREAQSDTSDGSKKSEGELESPKEPIMFNHFKEFLHMFKMGRKKRPSDNSDVEGTTGTEDSIEEATGEMLLEGGIKEASGGMALEGGMKEASGETPLEGGIKEASGGMALEGGGQSSITENKEYEIEPDKIGHEHILENEFVSDMHIQAMENLVKPITEHEICPEIGDSDQAVKDSNRLEAVDDEKSLESPVAEENNDQKKELKDVVQREGGVIQGIKNFLRIGRKSKSMSDEKEDNSKAILETSNRQDSQSSNDLDNVFEEPEKVEDGKICAVQDQRELSSVVGRSSDQTLSQEELATQATASLSVAGPQLKETDQIEHSLDMPRITSEEKTAVSSTLNTSGDEKVKMMHPTQDQVEVCIKVPRTETDQGYPGPETDGQADGKVPTDGQLLRFPTLRATDQNESELKVPSAPEEVSVFDEGNIAMDRAEDVACIPSESLHLKHGMALEGGMKEASGETPLEGGMKEASGEMPLDGGGQSSITENKEYEIEPDKIGHEHILENEFVSDMHIQAMENLVKPITEHEICPEIGDSDQAVKDSNSLEAVDDEKSLESPVAEENNDQKKELKDVVQREGGVIQGIKNFLRIGRKSKSMSDEQEDNSKAILETSNRQDSQSSNDLDNVFEEPEKVEDGKICAVQDQRELSSVVGRSSDQTLSQEELATQATASLSVAGPQLKETDKIEHSLDMPRITSEEKIAVSSTLNTSGDEKVKMMHPTQYRVEVCTKVPQTETDQGYTGPETDGQADGKVPTDGQLLRFPTLRATDQNESELKVSSAPEEVSVFDEGNIAMDRAEDVACIPSESLHLKHGVKTQDAHEQVIQGQGPEEGGLSVDVVAGQALEERPHTQYRVKSQDTFGGDKHEDALLNDNFGGSGREDEIHSDKESKSLGYDESPEEAFSEDSLVGHVGQDEDYPHHEQLRDRNIVEETLSEDSLMGLAVAGEDEINLELISDDETHIERESPEEALPEESLLDPTIKDHIKHALKSHDVQGHVCEEAGIAVEHLLGDIPEECASQGQSHSTVKHEAWNLQDQLLNVSLQKGVPESSLVSNAQTADNYPAEIKLQEKQEKPLNENMHETEPFSEECPAEEDTYKYHLNDQDNNMQLFDEQELIKETLAEDTFAALALADQILAEETLANLGESDIDPNTLDSLVSEVASHQSRKAPTEDGVKATSLTAECVREYTDQNHQSGSTPAELLNTDHVSADDAQNLQAEIAEVLEDTSVMERAKVDDRPLLEKDSQIPHKDQMSNEYTLPEHEDLKGLDDEDYERKVDPVGQVENVERASESESCCQSENQLPNETEDGVMQNMGTQALDKDKVDKWSVLGVVVMGALRHYRSVDRDEKIICVPGRKRFNITITGGIQEEHGESGSEWGKESSSGADEENRQECQDNSARSGILHQPVTCEEAEKGKEAGSSIALGEKGVIAGKKGGNKSEDSITPPDPLSREVSLESTEEENVSLYGKTKGGQDDGLYEYQDNGDFSDELGIIYEEDSPLNSPGLAYEMKQDDRGVMLPDSDDEESENQEVVKREKTVITEGDRRITTTITKTNKVRFQTSNQVSFGWKAGQQLSEECVPDSGGLEGHLKDAASKMTKMLQESEQAQRDQSPDLDGAQAKVTLQAYGLKIGDKVMVGGVKTGILRYCGPTEFASGIWSGIELDEPAGKNDGSVGGVCYFKCSSKHGIFAPVTKISKPGILVNRGQTTPRRAVNHGHVDTSKVTAKVDTGLNRSRSGRSVVAPPDDNEIIDVGERVLVAGQRRGVIRFSGEADFAPGWWYGIELDRPVGKNDGSVNGKRYFTCKPKYGVFAPPSRIQKLSDLPDAGECLDAVAERQRRLSSGSGSQPALHATPSKIKASFSRPKSSGSTGIVRRSLSLTNPGGEFRLQEGTSVFCNNELGVIRYIGNVDFAEGIWLGVELRTSKGKNDGSVQGHRYFTCRPNHGLIVRPSKVTVRGINGAKLMGNLDLQTETDKKEDY